eukprot:m51a1_g14342 hypothetical protein (129) ;mRNA; r:161846-162232
MDTAVYLHARLQDPAVHWLLLRGDLECASRHLDAAEGHVKAAEATPAPPERTDAQTEALQEHLSAARALIDVVRRSLDSARKAQDHVSRQEEAFPQLVSGVAQWRSEALQQPEHGDCGASGSATHEYC